MKEYDSHLEQFKRFEHESAQDNWLLPLRRSGMERFSQTGFPGLNDEDWRFTNVAPISKLPFKPVPATISQRLGSERLAMFPLMGLPANRLVFVDGHFDASLSSVSSGDGEIICSLSSAIRDHKALLEPHLARHVSMESSPFTALNTAFFQDGAFVHLPKGCVLDVPIHLVYVSTSVESGSTSHPRNLIIAGAGSQATILETHTSLHESAYVTNAATEFVLGEGANVEHCKYQDESLAAFHIAALHANLARSANFISHSIAIGARLSRNNIRTVLGGEGVECVLNGLYLTHRDQLADHHMVVEHAEPHCNSHEYFNGILDGKSKGVFHGRILVRQAAQKTDAKQTNKNLLLSEDATVDTKPQLEIYADDVKCTHGATIGQLNEESIFYLRTRGIGAETARHMLIHAFAGEIIERVRHPALREELNRLVWDRLEANPHVATQQSGPNV